MTKDAFKTLRERLFSKETAHVEADGPLSEILDHHFEMIAAAHHDVHTSNHHSHPGEDDQQPGG
jgi:uncharacterized protein (DUF2267 family)